MYYDGVQVQVPQTLVVGTPEIDVAPDVDLATEFFAGAGVVVTPGTAPKIEARPEG